MQFIKISTVFVLLLGVQNVAALVKSPQDIVPALMHSSSLVESDDSSSKASASDDSVDQFYAGIFAGGVIAIIVCIIFIAIIICWIRPTRQDVQYVHHRHSDVRDPSDVKSQRQPAADVDSQRQLSVHRTEEPDSFPEDESYFCLKLNEYDRTFRNATPSCTDDSSAKFRKVMRNWNSWIEKGRYEDMKTKSKSCQDEALQDAIEWDGDWECNEWIESYVDREKFVTMSLFDRVDTLATRDIQMKMSLPVSMARCPSAVCPKPLNVKAGGRPSKPMEWILPDHAPITWIDNQGEPLNSTSSRVVMESEASVKVITLECVEKEVPHKSNASRTMQGA